MQAIKLIGYKSSIVLNIKILLALSKLVCIVDSFVLVLEGYQIWKHYKLLDLYIRYQLGRLSFYQIW